MATKEYMRVWRATNRDKVNAQQKRWRENNKEKVSNYSKLDYAKHKEKRLKRGKVWYSENPLYRTWSSMISRCYNPNTINYAYYGARGIRVCDSWLNSYDQFVVDMGFKPQGLTLDRIDVNGDYTPENCRWTTWKQQNNNQQRHISL
jgi:hypothetical protein